MAETFSQSPNRRCACAGPAPAVILCDCGRATPSQRLLVAEADALVRARGLAALRATDLCSAVARRDPRLLSFPANRPLLVVACRPRAVRWLVHAAGLPAAGSRLDVVDLRQEPEAARAEMKAHLACAEAGPLISITADDGWVSWFPVVDHERCQRCGQCASFCLFGVYSLAPERSVTVARPEACKTNCPACARVCPSAAIMFPKHDEPPFEGSEVADEDAVKARTRHYTQELLGEDPYAALAARRARAELLRSPTQGAPR